MVTVLSLLVLQFADRFLKKNHELSEMQRTKISTISFCTKKRQVT